MTSQSSGPEAHARRSRWATRRPVATAAAVSLPLFVVVFTLAGSGHGRQLPLLLLFPFGPLVALAGGFSHLSSLGSIASALVQFPLYVLVLRNGARSGWFRGAVAVVVVAHMVAVALVTWRML